MKQSNIKSGKLLLCLAILRKITGKNLFSLLVYGFLLLLYAPPGNTSERLGVVRSQDNAQQWSNITERLQAATVDYCIVETANWKQPSDLGEIDVLLLPNVSALTEAQAEALNGWMNQGESDCHWTDRKFISARRAIAAAIAVWSLLGISDQFSVNA